MASNDQASDVATYAASVRAALSDLPSDQAAVLLEDLEDHLREIAAETGGTLTERLGPPGTAHSLWGHQQRQPSEARPGVSRLSARLRLGEKLRLVSRGAGVSPRVATGLVGAPRLSCRPHSDRSLQPRIPSRADSKSRNETRTCRDLRDCCRDLALGPHRAPEPAPSSAGSRAGAVGERADCVRRPRGPGKHAQSYLLGGHRRVA